MRSSVLRMRDNQRRSSDALNRATFWCAVDMQISLVRFDVSFSEVAVRAEDRRSLALSLLVVFFDCPRRRGHLQTI